MRGCDRGPAAQHARNTAAGGRRDGYALKGIAIVHEDYKATFAVSLPGLRLKTHRRSATIQHRLVVGEDAHVGSLAKVPEQVVAVGAESKIRQRISLALRHVFSVQADSFFISGRCACRVAEVSKVFAVGTECVIRTVDLKGGIRTLRYT